MADFTASITCLSGTYAAYITQEVAAQMTKVANIVASFTDPLEKLGSVNVTQLTKDISSLASGNVAGSLGSIGAAIIVNKVKRELRSILADVIEANPGIGDRIQQIANISDAVYGIVSLAVMLRKESPYAAVALVIEDLEELLEQKTNNLNQLQSHIRQLNNAVMAATQNASATASLLRDDLAQAVDFLDDAGEDLTRLQIGLSASPSQFIDKHFDSAKTNLESAEELLSPGTDVNILDVTTLLAPSAVGNDFTTEAQIKLATFAVKPLALLIQCEMDSIDKLTTRINNYIERLPQIIPDYEASSESSVMKEFRIKLIRQLRSRLSQLSSDMDEAINKPDIGSLGLQALSWCARVETLLDMLPRVENQLQVESEDDARLESMAAELATVISELSDINDTFVTSGLEDTTALRSQVSFIVGSANNIMTLIGSPNEVNYDIGSFQASLNNIANGSTSSIETSKSTVTEIEAALDNFNTTPPQDQTLDDLLNLLELLGMDRAKALLKIGKFTDFLNTTIDDASYIGLAIKCLIDTEGLIQDTETLRIITGIREELESIKFSRLSAAFDIIDSGKNAAILEVENFIQEGQDNLQKVNRVVDTLKKLASDAGSTVDQIEAAADSLADGLGAELGEFSWMPNGELNQDLSDLDIDGLQAGCLGQLKF